MELELKISRINGLATLLCQRVRVTLGCGTGALTGNNGILNVTSHHFSDLRSRDGVDACRGSLSAFSSILSPAWRAATVFSGLAVLTSVLTLLAWLSICVASTLGLFKVSGCLQIISGVFMLITILSYPAGWDNSSVISVCGPEVIFIN